MHETIQRLTELTEIYWRTGVKLHQVDAPYDPEKHSHPEYHHEKFLSTARTLYGQPDSIRTRIDEAVVEYYSKIIIHQGFLTDFSREYGGRFKTVKTATDRGVIVIKTPLVENGTPEERKLHDFSTGALMGNGIVGIVNAKRVHPPPGQYPNIKEAWQGRGVKVAQR